MSPFDAIAWLGPAADDTTPEQREALTRAAEAVNARFPGEDDGEVREAALNAAAQVILGDDEPEAIADRWRAARRAEQEARAALTGAIIAAAPTSSESALSERLGVARDTVRKALGKARG
ncbi:hypothetical protein [Actinotalea sp. JY-7876]|uniref:hypothetical protein n=1 Tax=Actinotalea sp. JY-7876 TaxID=2758442 RepID=UPI0015F440D8|nr:hypothetical protein [Actinotalea sp. JY-7876]